MKKTLTSLCICLASLCSMQAEIIETAHFCDLQKHITKDTLVILDIDDTLLITEQMLGCDEWFMTRLAHWQETGLSKQDSLERSLAEWEAVRHLTRMQIVENGTDSIVGAMQSDGYTVMGLSTQGLALATRTKQQLRDNNIDLSKTSPHKTDECVNVSGHTALYRSGILFTSGCPKGEALFLLLDKIGYTAKRIVFINDKATHLQDVEAVAQEKGVPFIGLRYSYSDAKKKAFDPKIANYQFSNSTFTHILSDQEAKSAMTSD